MPTFADPDDIRGWQRLSDGVTTSGCLTCADPARLAAIGVRHVINLALDDHPEALAKDPRASDDPRAAVWAAFLEADESR
jgi:hypothetical protein